MHVTCMLHGTCIYMLHACYMLRAFNILRARYMYCTGTTAATMMNHESSRSHVIFTITVERSDLGSDHQQHVRMGKLHLVDLAVSLNFL